MTNLARIILIIFIQIIVRINDAREDAVDGCPTQIRHFKDVGSGDCIWYDCDDGLCDSTKYPCQNRLTACECVNEGEISRKGKISGLDQVGISFRYKITSDESLLEGKYYIDVNYVCYHTKTGASQDVKNQFYAKIRDQIIEIPLDNSCTGYDVVIFQILIPNYAKDSTCISDIKIEYNQPHRVILETEEQTKITIGVYQDIQENEISPSPLMDIDGILNQNTVLSICLVIAVMIIAVLIAIYG